MRRNIAGFLGVGILNTVVGYSIYAILLLLNVTYLGSLLIATIAGIIFNYFSIGRLVFQKKGGLSIFLKFIAAYGIVYLVNACMLGMAIGYFQIGPYIAQALCIPPSVLISWLLMNYWVYKND